MKKILLLLMVLNFITGCSNKSDIPESKKQQAIQHFKTQEPTTKDSTWLAKRTFSVGVLDDGTKRDGYALYVCQVLSDMGIHDVRVIVIDISKLVTTDKWVKLGAASCDW